MSVKTALRRLIKAMKAGDKRATDDAIEELEVAADEEPVEVAGSVPDTLEIHNHIPEADAADRRADDSEAPPWFSSYQESMDRRLDDMCRDIKSLQDRRGPHDRRDGSLTEWAGEEEAEHGLEDEGNLEMDRRDRRSDDRRDRRSDDEPAEREEMAERVREGNSRDRRDRRADDDGNREILGELEFEAPPGTGDKARRAKDSAFLEESFQDTVAKAEIVAPGIRIPTFDRSASPARTLRLMHGLRRTALDLAYSGPATRGVIDRAMSGRTLDTRSMSISNTRVLFNAVAASVEMSNSNRATDRGTEAGGGVRVTAGARIQSVADINAANKTRYGRRAG